jgi:hypothetical protein
MKIYNHIKILNGIIKDQKKDLSFVKDKTRRKILIERINNLVDARNSFDSVITYKYKLNSLDTIILSLVKSMLMNDKGHIGKEYNLEMYLKTLGGVIQEGKEHKKNELISYFNNNYDVLMMRDYNKTKDKDKLEKDLLDKPDFKFWNRILEDFLEIIKTDLLWKIK